jgi:hypothetical protein
MLVACTDPAGEDDFSAVLEQCITLSGKIEAHSADRSADVFASKQLTDAPPSTRHRRRRSSGSGGTGAGGSMQHSPSGMLWAASRHGELGTSAGAGPSVVGGGSSGGLRRAFVVMGQEQLHVVLEHDRTEALTALASIAYDDVLRTASSVADLASTVVLSEDFESGILVRRMCGA